MYNCKLQAHRGVAAEYPENTMPAFIKAYEQGYDIIEFDPKMTADHIPVVLHDRTLNRTGRIAGETLKEEKKIENLRFADLCDVDVGMWKSAAFAGTHIPTLSQALDYMKSVGLEAKIDNVVQTFSDSDREIVFETVRRHADEALTGFTFSRLDMLRQAAERFPRAILHYDGEITEENLSRLKEIVAGHKTYVWMRYDNALTSWNKNIPVNEQWAKRIKRDFLLGVWILESDEDFAAAAAFEPDVVETTGTIKPPEEKRRKSVL